MRIVNQQTIGTRALHVSRTARDRYHFDQSLFSMTGDVVFANFHATRTFAQKMNQKRDLLNFPEQTIRAGQLNALGLLDEITHFIINLYSQQQAPQALENALSYLDTNLGVEKVDAALRRFIDDFPPLSVYRRGEDALAYLRGSTDGVSNRQLLLEELLVLWLENVNPAFTPYQELFDDAGLEKETPYLAVVTELAKYFAEMPTFGPDNQSLPDMLRTPAVVVPHSLPGQLEYVLTHWGYLLGRYLYRILGSLDLIKEEEKAIFGGPGPALVYDYAGLGEELERFSMDKDWMPHVVMIAKNTYVWLDQLSRKYGRAITRLDQIPDEELQQLARWGFTGLWLIGVWERSRASQTVKQWCGNPEAVASAYSLYAYDVAGDLGGQQALDNLRERAWRHGIRLASDMVPNHMGIDSPWVVEHPDWFISLDYSPFPSYSFTGASVSGNDRVGIFVEDHYFMRNDAAVVFKRMDFWTGNEKYIYHGNDGTSMPWNDTAQLNFLHPEVREAVIQTILHVAKQFPIIRFDAAMTLAKKHYQRLWFPEPGTGGAIPSRAEHGLTRQQFNQAIPEEFWREVVDRVALEAPDTLLLAEAFWLMEGYFVRTLGMHRVYNSAFMNMLRDEDNAKYRSVMKNTLEFDPDILKRFVNFMNNPDERTAVDQFGTGDKYFGICVLMATLPGLPMFGHGQIEGFAEKYGMEYRRAYWDEQANASLVQRHEREIAPLLHRRHIFAESRDFLLYDFFTPEGHINEDVFAYSNRCGDERGLVIYHNKYASAHGWVRNSVGFAVKDGAEKSLAQRNLGEGLGLRHDGQYFTIFRDQITGLEYIRNSAELCDRGLYIELDAYKYHVFTDFREVCDNEWHHYAHLAGYLNGRGVPSISEALRELFLQPVHTAVKEAINAGYFHWLIDNRTTETVSSVPEKILTEAEGKARGILEAVRQYTSGSGDVAQLASELSVELEALLRIPRMNLPITANASLGDDPAQWAVLFSWLFTHNLGKVVASEEYADISRSWIDEWLLGRIIAGVMRDLGQDEASAWWRVLMVNILVAHQDWLLRVADEENPAYALLTSLLQDPEAQRFLQVNRHQDVLWFNQEAFTELLDWLLRIAAIMAATGANEESERLMASAAAIRQVLQQAEQESDYQVSRLLEAAQQSMPV